MIGIEVTEHRPRTLRSLRDKGCTGRGPSKCDLVNHPRRACIPPEAARRYIPLCRRPLGPHFLRPCSAASSHHNPSARFRHETAVEIAVADLQHAETADDHVCSADLEARSPNVPRFSVASVRNTSSTADGSTRSDGCGHGRTRQAQFDAAVVDTVPPIPTLASAPGNCGRRRPRRSRRATSTRATPRARWIVADVFLGEPRS